MWCVSFAVDRLLGGLLLACLALACSDATAELIQHAPSGCPMAHCDARMSDTTNTAGPARGDLLAIDSTTAGAKVGLGCSSNTIIVACSTGGEPPASTLVVLDVPGTRPSPAFTPLRVRDFLTVLDGLLAD